MRASRRRTRRTDPLASPEAVRDVLDNLRGQCPDILPKSETQLVRMLESVRHYGRSPAVNGGRGRPRRWPREAVSLVARKLKEIMRQVTGSRVSESSFISLYLPILRYPADVVSALVEGELNIREAAYLARLTHERLKCSSREARQVRGEMVKAHVLTNGSQSSLRLRVKAILGEIPEESWNSGEVGRLKADALLRENPHDPRHLFYEEIQRLTETMNQIEADELNAEALGEVLRQIDKLFNMLRRIKQQGRGKHGKTSAS
jgi:phage terminase Nu1 subunit (DNA packaging protein)